MVQFKISPHQAHLPQRHTEVRITKKHSFQPFLVYIYIYIFTFFYLYIFLYIIASKCFEINR